MYSPALVSDASGSLTIEQDALQPLQEPRQFCHVHMRACMLLARLPQIQQLHVSGYACRRISQHSSCQSGADRFQCAVIADGRRSMGKIKDLEAKKKAAHVFR